MIILVLWKPVVIIWLLLSAMLWCGYVDSSLMEEKNPFSTYTLQSIHARHSGRPVHRQAYPRKYRDRPMLQGGTSLPSCSSIARVPALCSL